MNRALGEEVSGAAHQFLDEIALKDKVAVWKYGEKLCEGTGPFSEGHENLESSLVDLRTPPFSEVNFYDSLLTALDKMRTATGRKALIVISSGLDTFSKASGEAAIQAARERRHPHLMCINLAPSVRQHAAMLSSAGPYLRLDWKQAEMTLRKVAESSGGRIYSPQSTLDLSAIYDDLMENLRVRYLITYKSNSDRSLDAPRTVRIELVDSKTGGPLEIVDNNGKPVRSKISAEDNYVPRGASASGATASGIRRPKRLSSRYSLLLAAVVSII